MEIFRITEMVKRQSFFTQFQSHNDSKTVATMTTVHASLHSHPASKSIERLAESFLQN
jgi:hypothetical protein